ncbi:MAG: hypothetical protein ACUVRV_08300 [Cyanobacteriota bacterium]
MVHQQPQSKVPQGSRVELPTQSAWDKLVAIVFWFGVGSRRKGCEIL